MQTSRFPIIRLLTRLVQHSEGCWVWTGATEPTGYGAIKIDGTKVNTHRLAWELLRGPIPSGLTIDHLCRVRSCCNPEHMEVVTRAENGRRGGVAYGEVKRAKTQCAHGHEWTQENTYWRPVVDGHTFRECRICRSDRKRTGRPKPN